MNAQQLHEVLVEWRACRDAVRWTKGKTLATAWRTCKRANWMFWFVYGTNACCGIPAAKAARLALKDCADLATRRFPRTRVQVKRIFEGGLPDVSLLCVADMVNAAGCSSQMASRVLAEMATAIRKRLGTAWLKKVKLEELRP